MTATVHALAATDLFGSAREQLWTVLAPVLPDRVYAYAPSPVAAPVAPTIWIGRHDSLVDEALWVLFTVTALSDGADHAAQAMVDSVTSGMFAAVTATPGMRWDGSTWTTLDVAADVVLRGVDATVAVLAGARTWCPPVPHTALIPPTIIPITGGP